MALVASALLAILAAACLPGPDDPVEYVHEKTAVLLQLQDVPAELETATGRSLPEVTLYGDGAVIYLDGAGVLMQAVLPDDAVEDLLASAVDEGFLDFDYEQPVPDSAAPEPITYLYVQTRGDANAVKARGLGTASEGDTGGDEFTQYGTLEQLRDDFLALDPVDLGAEPPVPFETETALIWAEPVDAEAGAPEWPYPGVPLTEIAADPGRSSAAALVGGTGVDVAQGATLYQQDGQTYRVSFRPLLPYENAFPEFDSLGG